jgi:hypothetical protein
MIRVVHPGSGSLLTHPGSRIQGSKRHRIPGAKRHRIPDPGVKKATDPGSRGQKAPGPGSRGQKVTGSQTRIRNTSFLPVLELEGLEVELLQVGDGA